MNDNPYQSPQTAEGSLSQRRIYDPSMPPLVALIVFWLICVALLFYVHG